MVVTVTEVCYRALRLTGWTTQPGRGLATEEAAEALNFFNQMIDSWNIMRNMLHQVKIYRFPLVPSQATYTIGPTGDFPTTTRPDFIEAVKLILTSSSPESSFDLYMMDSEEYEALWVQEMPSSIPIKVYIDGDYPNRKVYLWGYPTEANDLQFFVPNALDSAYTSGDSVSVPSGYMKTLVYNLAVDCSVLFPPLQGVDFQDVKRQAQEMRAALASVNVSVPLLVNDAALLVRNGKNINYYANRYLPPWL